MELKNSKILIVDDEVDLCEILQYNLDNAGCITDVAHSAEEALSKLPAEFDLILLDVMMGPMSGFRLADHLRKELAITTPIIFLTAKDTENDILTGFSIGADDYMAKPFSVNELIARVKAVLKRADRKTTPAGDTLIFKDLSIDRIRKRAIIGNRKIELTKKEYEILNLLCGSPGTVFSREDLLSRIWGDDVIVTERTVDVNITRLRSKLENFGTLIRNKSGYGYYFEVEE
jgi:DNA-binding response OmpR family regulator